MATADVLDQPPPTYPDEDVCEICGAHVGWILNPDGEGMRLGRCDAHPRVEEEF